MIILKWPILETRITMFRRNQFSFTEYDLVTTFYSDGSQTVREVPGKIHFVEPLGVI